MKAKLEELLAKLTNVPIIVETGTSGIWTYRKWSDGTSECWGLTSKTATSGQTNIKINYPTSLFISTPVLTASGTVTGNINSGVRYTGGNATGCDIWITSEVTGTAWFSINAIGKWK